MIPSCDIKMAEGGSSDQEDNPFSFQKFVKKKGKNESEDGSDEEDIFDLPDVSTPMKNKKPEAPVEDEGEPVPKKKEGKKSGDENPFSFKKFLKSSGDTRPKNYACRNRSGLAAPDFASDLPDFVQDHYSSEAGHERLSLRDPLELPDFTLDTSPDKHSRQNSSHSTDSLPNDNDISGPVNGNISDPPYDFHLTNGCARGQPPDINSFDIDIDHCMPDAISDDEVSDPGEGPQLASSLPDFLSDGAMGNTDSATNQSRAGITVQLSCRRNVAAFEVNGDLELELRRVREENSRLRSQLDEQAIRLSEANQRIEAIEKREAEDTAALEKMVHQVEANLVTTTQRAVLAESAVSKLKQENKVLDSQLKSLKGDNQGENGDQRILNIKERTNYASEQLTSAAKTAEQTIKELLKGVDSMKLLAEVLSSIDKISEAETSGGGNSPEGAQGGQS